MPESVHLVRNEEHLVSLGGSGSAGYTWGAEVEEGEGVVEVSKKEVGRPPLEPGAVPETTGAEQVFSIRALRPGRARVRLLLRRPWLKSAKPAQERVIYVEVTE